MAATGESSSEVAKLAERLKTMEDSQKEHTNKQEQLEQSQNKLKQTQIQLEKTQAQLEKTQAQLEKTQAQLEKAQAQHEKTQTKFKVSQKKQRREFTNAQKKLSEEIRTLDTRANKMNKDIKEVRLLTLPALHLHVVNSRRFKNNSCFVYIWESLLLVLLIPMKVSPFR